MRKYILLLLFSTPICFAGNGNFYTDPGIFMAKLSGACSSGNVVQAILQSNSHSAAPSNSSPFLGTGELLSDAPQSCEEMGTDKFYEFYFGDGKLGSVNSAPDTHMYGYMRAFSCTSIVYSAYFGNSPCEHVNFSSGSASDNPITGIVNVATVNPAYNIPFDYPPTNGSSAGQIIGQVFATTAGGNNQLESGFILIEWRYAGSNSRTTGDSSLGALGNFDFTVSVPQTTNIFVRARVKNAFTPMPGFPISEEFEVTVDPLPAPPAVTITAPNGGSDYSVSIGAHSTNVSGTVDIVPDSMYWTNTLNNSGGALTPATSFSFSAQLDIGVNAISVFASNVGGSGSDSINITANPYPPPTVSISTSNILANSWPVAVQGTSSGADSVLLSNTVTGATFPCTGTDNWSVNITGNDNTAQDYVAVAINVGGYTLSSPILIDHDDIPPTVSQISPENNFTSTSDNVTFTFTANDDRHSIAYTQIRFDGGAWQAFSSGNSSTFSEGLHTWQIRAADNVGSGNISNPSASRNFYVFEPPAVAFSHPVSSGTYNTNGAVNMTIPVDGTVTDGSNVILSNTTSATEYSASVAAGVWTVTNVMLARGNNTLIVTATRNGVASSAQITVVNQEPGTPVVTIVSPNNGNDYSVDFGNHSTNISGSVDVTPDLLTWTNSLTGNGGLLTNTNNFSFEVNLVTGTNVITVFATRAGKIGTDLITITVSEPAPTVAFVNPISSGTYNTNGAEYMTIPVDGTVTENATVILSNITTAAEYSGNVIGSAWYVSDVALARGNNSLIAYAILNNVVSQPAQINVNNQNIIPSGKPFIAVLSPTNWTSFPSARSIDISGVATDDVAVVTITRNGTDITASYNPPNWTDSRFIGFGTNTFVYVAIDGDGNQSTDTVHYIVTDAASKTPPYIEVLSPSNMTVFPVIQNINVSGIATDNYSVVSIFRNNTDISASYSPPDWSDVISTNLLTLGSNYFSYIAIDSNGNSATDTVCYIILSNNVPEITARVLETWPRFIGSTQTGTIEFISKSTASWNLFVFNSLNSNSPIATGTCTTGWNLIEFYGGNLPITDDDYSNILQLVIGNGASADTLDADSVSVVKDLNVTGSPTGDFDDDLIYVKFKTKTIGKISAKGRTIFIKDASPADKLIVKVKPAKGRGDGVAAICGIFSDNSINGIKIMGDLDKLNINGSLNKLILIGGSLGRPNQTLRYNASFSSLPTMAKTKILLKAGKNKTNGAFIPANCYANILSGTLINEPDTVKNLTGIKMLKIVGGNLGVPYNENSNTTFRHWLNAKYADIILVKPKAHRIGGKTFDYSFYFTGENIPNKGSFKKIFLYNGCEDSSENNKDNINIICGYDSNTNAILITGTNWIGANVQFGFGKIITKAGELQGTIAIKKWIKGKIKQVKGLNDARWIVDGNEE